MEEGREGGGRGWEREAEGKGGDEKGERDLKGSASTLSFRVTKEFGSRYFDFEEGLSNGDLGLLVEEEVFFRPSEKTNGDE